MNAQVITIITFGHFEKGILERISGTVVHEFDCTVLIKEARVDFSEFYDPARRQYNGDKLLREVAAMQIPGSGKTIGLFTVDLFIPILTYIFGQAQLGGHTAIASLFRLSNESYGLPKAEQTLTERFTKEVIHELGHTFGLIHCHTPTCVMRSSTYAEDIDQKEERLCVKCRTELLKARSSTL